MIDTRTALYLIYGDADVLLYVGIGFNPFLRWEARSGNAWWSRVRRCEVQWFGTRAEAEAAEIDAIKSLRPLYNVQHNRYRRILTADSRRELELESSLWLTVAQVERAFGVPASSLWGEIRAYRVASTTGVPDRARRCNPACIRELLARLGLAEPLPDVPNQSEDLT